MPKIIENAREEILLEARRQLFANGYAKTTIRSVASAIGIGTGTIYNYFSSKDEMLSSFILLDWRECLDAMKILDPAKNGFFKKLHDLLQDFIEKYRFLFQDKDATQSFLSVFQERHAQLRGVLADVILPACMESHVKSKRFLAEQIAQSILFWTMEGVPFKKQKEIIDQLLR